MVEKGKKRKEELSKKINDELNTLIMSCGDEKYGDEPLYKQFIKGKI